MKAKEKVESTNTFNAKTQLKATSLSFQNIKEFRTILFVFCFINVGNEQSTFQCLQWQIKWSTMKTFFLRGSSECYGNHIIRWYVN